MQFAENVPENWPFRTYKGLPIRLKFSCNQDNSVPESVLFDSKVATSKDRKEMLAQQDRALF